MVIAEILVLGIMHNAAWAVTVWLGPIPICLLAIVWLHRMSLRGIAHADQAFARAYSLRYIHRSKLNYSKHFQPSIAKLGVLERKEYIAKGNLNGRPYETFIFSYRHLLARRYARVRFRVFCIQLPKELPHIFIRRRLGAKKVYESLPRYFDNDQRIDLEGNFSDYFAVYTHRRTATEALSILAPNVMQAILDSNQYFDIEIVGNKLFLYSSMTTPAAYDPNAANPFIQTLMMHIEHRLKSWRFVLPNNKHYPYIVSRPGFGTMTFGNRYYNRSWRYIAFFAAYISLQILTNKEYRLVRVIIGGSILTATIVLLLIFRRRYQLQNRNIAR